MTSSVFGLVPERAQRIEHRLHGFELLERRRVVYVHDEVHAAELLGARGAADGDDLLELARALARGDLLLVESAEDMPLDPPDPNAVPLLSDLVPDGGDPIALEPDRPRAPELARSIALGRIDGAAFGHDFVRPACVRAIGEVIGLHDEGPVVVEAYAADGELAQQRADRVRQLLAHDADGWLARYEAEDVPWGAREDQLMVRALPDFASKDPAEDPITWFQQTRGLAADGIAGPQTRGALVREYMADATLPEGTEVEAVSRVSADEHLELFFFNDGLGVQPASSDPAAHDGWQQRVRRTLTKSVAHTDAGQLVPILQAEDIHFGLERVVFLPEPPRAEDDPQTDGVTGLSFARAVLQQAYLEPEKHVVFVGHADASGSKDANLVVSRDRAENIALFVTGQRDAWAAHCISHYAVDDVQHLLAWTASAWGWDTLPGEIDNEIGPLTEGALDRFRVAYNEELDGAIAESGSIAEADFAAFFDVMQASLAEMLDASAPPIADLHAAVRLLDEGVIACGEAWTSESVVMTDYPESCPRRVDVLFLDEHEAALASIASDPPLRELYGNPASIARPLAADPVPFGALQYEVWVELRTHFLDAVVGNVQYELVGPHPSEHVAREGVVDAKGLLREGKLASGNYQLRIDGELLPVAARIMDHHPEGLEHPSVLRFHGRDETARPIHLFPSAQADEWIVPGEEAGEEPDPEREDGA